MRTLPTGTTHVPLHLTVDPWWETLTALAFGRTDDGLPRSQVHTLDDEPRIHFLLDAPSGGPVIGFRVVEPMDMDVAALEAPELWTGPRFDVPALALTGATAGEILLAVQARFDPGEATADAIHFHRGIEFAGTERTDEAIDEWRMALEAGDMKALFALGYTYVEADRPDDAYQVLRRYTELTPHNAWAWCWLGRACAALGETVEARVAFERALRCEADGGSETDAAELLERLG